MHPLPRRSRDLHGRLLPALGVALLLVVVTLLIAWLGVQGSGTATAPTDIRAAVSSLVGGSVPGALLYVYDDGSSYSVVVGVADKVTRVPLEAGDSYPIGSTTKTYTAVLVLRLVAEGKVRLDATVARYLPGLLPDGDRITVRELLAHTSGLFDYAEDPRAIAPYLNGHLSFAWSPRQLVGFAARHPLLFTPGTRFAYSNTDYAVLGLLVERVGRASYERQLEDSVLRPLGLRHTSLPGADAALPDVHGYVSLRAYDRNAPLTPIDSAGVSPTYGWAAGGIRATAADVAAFLRGLLSGKLLPTAQLREMEDTAPTGGQYGLGLMPTGLRAYEWGELTQPINHGCGLAWGHGGNFPGYYQLPISSPDGKRQAVLLVNTDTTVLTQAQLKRIYAVLDTAFCRGVAS